MARLIEYLRYRRTHPTWPFAIGSTLLMSAIEVPVVYLLVVTKLGRGWGTVVLAMVILLAVSAWSWHTSIKKYKTTGAPVNVRTKEEARSFA